jgi:ABC-type Fe3+/spermidine/putrescine transport system ATPase subunit
MSEAKINQPKSSLILEQVTRALPSFKLEADFQINPGERAALVARSGGGKSTLLRMIAGLDWIDSGKIFLGSHEVTDLPPEKRETGYVFQDQALFPALNVLENVTFGLRVRGVKKSTRHEMGYDWLKKIGLGDLALRKTALLSGGEKQRVAFVRALIWNPALILLDEPFSALDSSGRDRVRQALLELHELWPVPMILVTHDESDVARLATCRLEIEEFQNSGLRQIRKVQKISN